ncbi:MAG: UDP-N-acetylmuramate--L-alanine ligase [Faecalibacterium sp.]|nr:UDP-N-acetylmuramate--L-alanine ligase [Ruminococcus sp.]MCM1391659.1 UDP-N-acetylmuramate--L-alanine ligase [Ruminococcus sp.]MCM1486216.1 UDP-N-acetylmuramate--L-alanine ligase [Faecalibacterium sp.]
MAEIDTILKQIKRIHFIGIGGSGMCPLAEILHSWGYEITGSDNNPGDNITKLESLGIKVVMGQKAENINGAEMIVYTAALLADNPELVAAKESGIPTFERSKLFGAITRMYSNCIGVCGTHGKTTVTSMLSQIMIMADKDPTAVIGGKLPLIDSHGRAGKSEHMVCEACEFVDTFLDLSPDVAVILNIDEDHLDYFKTLDNIIKSFHKFSLLTTNTLIYNGDDANTIKAVCDIDKNKITFGFNENNDYYPENITYNRGSFGEFDVMSKSEKIAHLKLNIPGTHNILNALAAFAAAVNAGVTPEECEKGIAAFAGAGRRFEILGEYKGITIADDYAHHPNELEATLSAVMKMGYKTVWAVFQPFTYSRTSILLDDFARVLQIPDKCVMTEIMGSREINTYNIYTKDLADKIPGSVWFNTFDEVVEHVLSRAESGDIIITLGCGDIYKAAKMMVEKLK